MIKESTKIFHFKILFLKLFQKKNITQEESDTFFSENEPISSIPSPNIVDECKNSQDYESLDEDAKDSKVYTYDLLGLKEDWDVVEFIKSDVCKDKGKEWEEKLFYPSTTSGKLPSPDC